MWRARWAARRKMSAHHARRHRWTLNAGTATVIAAMKKYDVKRVAVVTSIGAGDSFKDQAPFMFKMLMMTVMSSIFTDKNNQEALFTDGGVGRDLEWCIVRPGGLTVEKPTGVINVIEGEAGSIARADVADFCIGAILEEGLQKTPHERRPRLRYYDGSRHRRDAPTQIQKTPCISSVGGTSWVKDRSAAPRLRSPRQSAGGLSSVDENWRGARLRRRDGDGGSGHHEEDDARSGARLDSNTCALDSNTSAN